MNINLPAGFDPILIVFRQVLESFVLDEINRAIVICAIVGLGSWVIVFVREACEVERLLRYDSASISFFRYKRSIYLSYSRCYLC